MDCKKDICSPHPEIDEIEFAIWGRRFAQEMIIFFANNQFRIHIVELLSNGQGKQKSETEYGRLKL